MNGYERVRMAYTKQPYDKVPIYCGSVSSKIASQVLGHTAYVGGGISRYREACARLAGRAAHEEFVQKSREDALQWAKVNDFDFVRTSYWRYAHTPTRRLDDHTLLFERSDGSEYVMKFFEDTELFDCVHDTKKPLTHPDQLESAVVTGEKSAQRYRPDASAYVEYQNAMKHFDYQKAAYVGGLSLAIPNTSALWYEATVMRPDLVERHLDAQLVRACKNIPLLSALGASFVFGGGDCAGNRGLIYSKKVFETMLVPRLRTISDMCKKYGIFHTFGSDGCFWDVADALYVASGIDGHYEADCLCGMDIASVRKAYPAITVIGGIHAATLETGTVEQVKEQTSRALEAAKRYGGAIVGCSNLISPATPIKNFDAMMQLLHRDR